jgi:hypothetical protein
VKLADLLENAEFALPLDLSFATSAFPAESAPTVEVGERYP